LRALLTSYCFTISVLIALVITLMFAYVFEASQEQCATLVVLGILTAVAEYALRSDSERQP
jgi:formate-dependent nitrite reductase membrane component NrfD